MVEDQDEVSILYHYTTAKGYDGITKEGKINRSTKDTSSNASGPWFGRGIYLAVTPPTGTTQEILKEMFDFNYVDKNCEKYKKTEYAFGLRLSSLEHTEPYERSKRKVWVCRWQFMDLKRLDYEVYRRHIFDDESHKYPYKCEVTRLRGFVSLGREIVLKPGVSSSGVDLNSLALRKELELFRQRLVEETNRKLKEAGTAGRTWKHTTTTASVNERRLESRRKGAGNRSQDTSRVAAADMTRPISRNSYMTITIPDTHHYGTGNNGSYTRTTTTRNYDNHWNYSQRNEFWTDPLSRNDVGGAGHSLGNRGSNDVMISMPSSGRVLVGNARNFRSGPEPRDDSRGILGLGCGAWCCLVLIFIIVTCIIALISHLYTN